MASTDHSRIAPLQLAPNPVRRAHYGPGPLIRSFRGRFDDAPAAEDWLSADLGPRSAEPGSLVGQGRVFRTPGNDPTYLSELVAENPEAVVGVRARSGADGLGYLAKLLCPDRRIPVHCHPTDVFSRKWLPSHGGKTEGWLVLAAEGDHPNAWIGFRRPLQLRDWRDLIYEQESGRILDVLHPFKLNAGDVAFVPAGAPHAMGPGVLVFEPQQPSDWSILAEHEPFSLDVNQATISLGWDRAIECFDMACLSPDEAEATYIRRGVLSDPTDGVTPILQQESKDFFRVAALSTSSKLQTIPGPCWTGVVIDGRGRIEAPGGTLECEQGMGVFVPAGANPSTIVSDDTTLTILAMTGTEGSVPWEHHSNEL